MSLNDTESRLRDYLSDKARVVPDDATPPVLPATTHRHTRTWPALAAAATVLAITIPLLLRIGDRHEPAASSGPISVSVPYIVFAEKTLYDGDTKVRLPPGTELIGRATGGWLVLQRGPLVRNRGTKTRVGVLTKSGKFLQRGPDDILTATPSVDGTKVAVSSSNPKQKPSQTILRVIDLASGKELSTLRTPGIMVLQGWNSHGIWFSAKPVDPSGPMVWQPGRSAPRRITVPGFDQNIASVPGSDRMVVNTSADNHRTTCARVVELQASGALRTMREHCTRDEKLGQPALSPDGRYLVIPARDTAIEVETGRTIPLKNLPEPGWSDLVGYAFEDATHALILTHQPDRTTPSIALSTANRNGWIAARIAATTVAVVYRCEVVSGNCSTVYRAPAPGIGLPTS